MQPTLTFTPTPQTITHLLYYIPSRPTHKTHSGTTLQASSALVPQASHTHQYRTTIATPFPQDTSPTQSKFLHITAQT